MTPSTPVGVAEMMNTQGKAVATSGEPINFRLALDVTHPDCHKAADAFWNYWEANGETHKHGFYESTWGAINRAIRLVGVHPWDYGQPQVTSDQPEVRQPEPASQAEVRLTEEQIDAAINRACGTVRVGLRYDYEDLHAVVREVLGIPATPTKS